MTIRFKEVNRDTFNAIRTGEKKVETRAATVKYKDVKAGDFITLVCGKNSFEKRIKKVTRFRTIGAMLKKYKSYEINPKARTEKELREMYKNFPNYAEKLRRHGIVVWKLS